VLLPDRLLQADVQHLLGVIPFVQGAVGVQALIALQTDQVCPERGRQHLGDLSLADPGLAFDEHRLAQLHRQIDGRGDRAVGDVVLAFELALDFGNLRQQVKNLRSVAKL
jgi:hypothetical protein